MTCRPRTLISAALVEAQGNNEPLFSLKSPDGRGQQYGILTKQAVAYGKDDELALTRPSLAD